MCNLISKAQQKTSSYRPGLSQKFKENEQAPTTQLIQTKGKFNGMYSEMSKKLADLEEELLNQQEKTNELFETEKLIRQKLENIGHLNSKNKEQSDVQMYDLKAKLSQCVKGREESVDKSNRLTEQITIVLKENSRLQKLTREKAVEEEVEGQLFEAEVSRLREENTSREIIIKELSSKKQENEQMILNDIKLSDLKIRNNAFKDTLELKEKEVEQLGYKMLETESLQKLAIRQKEIESEERRQLADESGRLECLLNEIEKSNSLKVQRKTRELVNVELNLLEDQFGKENQELRELKSRFGSVHQFYHKAILEVKELREHKQEQGEQFIKLEEQLKELRMLLAKEESEFKVANSKVLEKEEVKNHLESQTNELEHKLTDRGTSLCLLKSKVAFLEEKFDFNDLMREFNMEDLTQVVNSNNSVNQTLLGVIQSWETIKNIGQESNNKL